MPTLPTTCPLDCPDACALDVTVDDTGRVTHLGGRRDHPDTAGFICGKVAGFHRRLDHPDRVLHPQRRVGPKGEGRFERISWEEAIDEIAGRLAAVRDEHGGEAILGYHYGGSNGKLTDGLLDDLLFARLGASRLDRTICAAVTGAIAGGMYGGMPGVAFGDYRSARAIVIWGANPRASNVHLVPALREAKRRGAFVALVDPRRTLSEADLDLHLPVLPGADLPLALALIRTLERLGAIDHHFLDRQARGADELLEAARAWTPERAAAAAGVEAADIERLAAAWAAAEPAVVRCGWGPERNRNGGPAIAAILALPALTGKLGAGGGYTLSNSGAVEVDRAALLGDLGWRTRGLNMSRLGRLLGPALDPPIRALFVYNANPAAANPDQGAVLAGLARDDLFTVVHEQVMTDTARWADVLLPATTFLEHRDLRGGYGSYVLGGVAPVVEPAGEARSNPWLFAALARALGFDDELFRVDEGELFRRLATATTIAGAPADAEALAAGRIQPADFPGPAPVPMETVRPRTPDGRIHLTPQILGSDPWAWRPPEDDTAAPLAMISPASPKRITSILGELDGPDSLEATLHPDDAAERGIADRDRVRLSNDLGELVCRARLDARVRRGVVSVPKGAWRRTSGNGMTSTALCPDHVNRVAGGACFNDARVEVSRVS